jgi:hypothetical protein
MADDAGLVPVYEASQRERIALAEYAFREAGIPYSLVNETVSIIYPGVDGMAIVRFEVLKEDVERARAVVKRLESD